MKNIKANELKNSTAVVDNTGSLMDRLPEMSQEALQNLKAMKSFRGSTEWQGLKVVPPGSFLEDALELFRVQTDIPLELPLISIISMVSGYLNSIGVQFQIGGSPMPPRLWTVALAPSGSGKTFAANKIKEWMAQAVGERVVPEIASASSAAKFVDCIQAVPKGLLLRDEFGQFLSQIQNLQYMEEIKDVLLRAYSNDPIERLTKETQITINDHAITILGITVGDTFLKQIGAESLVDGFAQRFNYIRAEKDPKRSITDFPIYFEEEEMAKPEMVSRLDSFKMGFRNLAKRNDLPDAILTFDPDAVQLFKDSFKGLFVEGEIPGSFYRRAMFAVFSYATVFHAIAGKMGTQVERDSVSLAVRMVALHLENARDMLNGYGLSELEKTLQKAEGIRDRLAAQGRPLKARDLVSGIREIRNAGQAHAIIGLLD